MPPFTPDLTAAFIVASQRQRGAWALRALLDQGLGERLEVLVFDVGHAEHPPLAGSDAPGVRVIPARNTGYGEILADAVHEARAPIIAFIEEHVVVLEGWAEALLQAHRAPVAAVGGEILPGDLSCAGSMRQELVSRNVWSAPAAVSGDAQLLRWQNVSYKREILLPYGDRLARFLGSEGNLFRQLRADGHKLAIEPKAKMVHAHETYWSAFLRGSYWSNRLSAASTIDLAPRPLLARLRVMASAALGPARWPLVLLRRTRTLPEADVWLPVFGANLPYVLQYYCVVAFAGMTGALFGRGSSHQRFLDYEITEARNEPTVLGAKWAPGDEKRHPPG